MAFPRAAVFVLVLVLGAIVACGDDPSSAGPPTHTIDTRNGVTGIGALLVAYEQGGRWRAADEVDDGVFAIAAPDRALGIAVICNDPVTSGQDPIFEHLLLGDEPDVAWPCFLPPDVPASFDVLPGDAVVAMRGRQHYPPGGESPRRTVTTLTVGGPQDLIAMTDTRLLVRRGVSFPLSEPMVLDVDTDGVPIATAAIDEPDADFADIVTYRASLVTANRTAARFKDTLAAGQVPVAPADVLIDSDTQRLLIGARNRDRWRGIEATAATIDAMRPHLVLPPPQLDVTVSWGARPDFRWAGALSGDITIIVAPGFESPAPRWIMFGSPEWQVAVGGESTGAWRAPDMANVQGWPDAWTTDTGADAHWTVTSERSRTAGDVQITEYDEADGYAP